MVSSSCISSSSPSTWDGKSSNRSSCTHKHTHIPLGMDRILILPDIQPARYPANVKVGYRTGTGYLMFMQGWRLIELIFTFQSTFTDILIFLFQPNLTKTEPQPLRKPLEKSRICPWYRYVYPPKIKEKHKTGIKYKPGHRQAGRCVRWVAAGRPSLCGSGSAAAGWQRLDNRQKISLGLWRRKKTSCCVGSVSDSDLGFSKIRLRIQGLKI